MMFQKMNGARAHRPQTARKPRPNTNDSAPPRCAELGAYAILVGLIEHPNAQAKISITSKHDAVRAGWRDVRRSWRVKIGIVVDQNRDMFELGSMPIDHVVHLNDCLGNPKILKNKENTYTKQLKKWLAASFC